MYRAAQATELLMLLNRKNTVLLSGRINLAAVVTVLYMVSASKKTSADVLQVMAANESVYKILN